MAEWLVEEGIAEHRAIRLEGADIVEARVCWPGELIAGTIVDAVLASRASGSSRGTARLPSGEEVLVGRLPTSAAEGASIRLEITRPALAERGRNKLAHARPSTLAPAASNLAGRLRGEGHEVQVVRRFPSGDWDELIAEAFAAAVAFPGGTLQFSLTPAMLLVDIDGTLAPRALALAAVPALASALRRFDLGGSIGIDFPTLQDRADRKAVDEALGDALAGWPHERTAMNGFGFVQLVARLERPSLIHRAALRRAATAWRLALRRAERLDGPGKIELAVNPAVRPHVHPDQSLELLRRTGHQSCIREDATLAIEAPQAQLVPL